MIPLKCAAGGPTESLGGPRRYGHEQVADVVEAACQLGQGIRRGRMATDALSERNPGAGRASAAIGRAAKGVIHTNQTGTATFHLER